MTVETDDPGKLYKLFDTWDVLRKLPKFQSESCKSEMMTSIDGLIISEKLPL